MRAPRAIVARALAGAVVALGAVVAAAPAWAQTPAPPATSPPPATPTTLGPRPRAPAPPTTAARRPATLAGCDTSAPPAAPGDEDEEGGERSCSTLMERIVPGVDPGPAPTSHYDIGYDRGGALSIDRKILGFLTDQVFAVARWAVRTGLWVINWALGFGFARRLAVPAQAVADTYQTRVVDGLGLGRFFLVLAACYGGWQALRGRMTRGVGEFAVSVVVAALAATTLAYPASVLVGALERTEAISMEVASITTAENPATTTADPANPVGPIAADLHRAFVETPHELLSWGRTFPAGDRCRAVYEAVVRTGPWGTKDEPRDAMEDAGCEAEARFNRDPSADRLGAAALVALAAVFVMVMLVMVAVTLVAAQLGVVVAVALAPFALTGGVLPGGGRQLLWRWVAGIGRSLAAVVMTAVFLSLFLVGVSALLVATSGEALMVQMGVIDVVVLIALVKRGKLVRAGKRAVTNVTQRLERARVGGEHGRGWLGPAAAGAAVGFGADELFDQARWRGQSLVAARRHASMRRAVRASGAAGPGFTAGGGPANAPARARVAAAVGRTKAGRAALGATKVATGTARLGLQASVGLPVYGPRAAQAASTRAVELRGRLVAAAHSRAGQAQAFGREYAQGVAAPARAARRVWQSTTGRP
ncbi:MAG TPA: hypothetical protein VFJ85_01125 [Acidimicrobiales bacterium]|nr:hypothetical protein [Acidimicrobiales bacterium]